MPKPILVLPLWLSLLFLWPNLLAAKLRLPTGTAPAISTHLPAPNAPLLMDPSISQITPFATVVGQYEKFEASVELNAQFDNPYDYDQVHLSAKLTSPSGKERIIDGFYMWDFNINGQNGNLDTDHSEGEFRIRFAPDEIGHWTYQLQLSDSQGTTTSSTQSFQCVESAQSENKGFIRSNQTNYLHFDNGEQYIAIGQNICWQNNNPFLDYQNWLGQLKAQGGNFFRLWHAHWGLGLEWRAGQQQYQGLRRYKESSAAYQDWLFDYCNQNGIYVLLTLQHHGQVSTQVNPNWSESPYNMANGGPCQHTWDFFTNEEAIKHTQNRLKYVMARWGYARSIMAWELFNEVEWTDDFEQHKENIINWHSEMAQYIRANDSYDHLITTSFAHEYNDATMWALPDMDFTQTHYYFNAANLERVLAKGVKKYIEEYGKPTLTGEFGLGNIGSELSDMDPDGIHFHNGLWSPLFSGGLGTGMSWWWDSYIAPNDLYYHMAPIAKMVAEIPFLDKNLQATPSIISGAPGDLSLTPTLGWGGIGTTDITIAPQGEISPTHAALGQYLYGAAWNTQHRSPPTFHFDLPEAGTFSVRTASSTGVGPRIAIYLDGTLVLSEEAQINSTYTVDVPAGAHSLQVDNIGTDWITISNYNFGGLGSALDTYILQSEDHDLATGWVLNNRYNHDYLNREGLPPVVQGAKLLLPGLNNGSYFVRWFDCLTGQLTDSEIVTATNDTLQLVLPDILWDLAFIVNTQPVSTEDKDHQLAFQLSPNPAIAGAEVSISLDERSTKKAQFQLLDMGGRNLGQLTAFEKKKNLSLQLPAHLPAGMYWLRMVHEGRVGARPIVIAQ